MLLLLLAVDATILSESSSIDLSGSVGLAFEGALIGNYDEEANPQGTLTRPGLFGGSGNQPISTSLSLRLALMTRVCLKVRSPLLSRAKRWSCHPLRRPCPVRPSIWVWNCFSKPFDRSHQTVCSLVEFHCPSRLGRWISPVVPSAWPTRSTSSCCLPLAVRCLLSLAPCLCCTKVSLICKAPQPRSLFHTLEVDGQISSDGAELSMSASTSVNESFLPRHRLDLLISRCPCQLFCRPGDA